MFAWIAGKKEGGQLPLSAASRDCLEKIAQRLKEAAPGDSLLTPEAVLERLLTGELTLVSALASVELMLDQEGIHLRDNNGAATPSQVEHFSPTPETRAEVEAEAPSESSLESLSPPLPSQTPPPEADTQPEIAALKQQINHLQERLNQRRDQQAAQHAKLNSLLKKSHQQEEEIASLKSQVEQLRASAAIGESQLNRWRFNNFSR